MLSSRLLRYNEPIFFDFFKNCFERNSKDVKIKYIQNMTNNDIFLNIQKKKMKIK